MTQPDMTPAVVEPTLVVTVTLSSGGVHVHRLPLSFVQRVFGADANVAFRRVVEVMEAVCDGDSHLWLTEPFAIYAAKDVARIQLEGLTAEQTHTALERASATMGFRRTRGRTRR